MLKLKVGGKPKNIRVRKTGTKMVRIFESEPIELKLEREDPRWVRLRKARTKPLKLFTVTPLVLTIRAPTPDLLSHESRSALGMFNLGIHREMKAFVCTMGAALFHATIDLSTL